MSFLKEMYPVAEGLEKYFKKYERPDGLLENVREKWNLVDCNLYSSYYSPHTISIFLKYHGVRTVLIVYL